MRIALSSLILPSVLTVLGACSTDFTIAAKEELEPETNETGSPEEEGGTAEGGGSGGEGGSDAGGTDSSEGQNDGGDGGTTDGGADGGADGGSDGGGSITDDTGAPADDGGSDGGGTIEPAPEDDCEDTSDKIYVIDKDTETLYLFDPPSLGLTALGELDCGSWSEPGSMGVSRDGRAFVRYSDQSVYEVELTSLACSPTSYSDRSTGFGAFGMGYATDSSTTWRDQLYIANGRQLATLDTSTFRVTSFATMPSQSELTGNAAGELWAILPLESPAELRQIDQSSGSVVQTIRLSGFPSPTDIDTFAFAAWGGDLYIFVREYGMGRSTDVYVVGSTGRLTLVASDIGINVVGAGVSTCAPTSTP